MQQVLTVIKIKQIYNHKLHAENTQNKKGANKEMNKIIYGKA